MLTPRTISTDILVIGGGPAGMWSAFTSKNAANDVLIVDKGPLDWGGVGSLSAGDFFALQPGMDLDTMMNELVYYYDELCDQNVVAGILRESIDRFNDYEAMGHTFVRDENGTLRGIPQRGLEYYRTYQTKPYGKGGESFTRELVARLDQAGVRRIGGITLTDLLLEDGCVRGAVGFSVRSGRPVIIEASAVVMATNNGSWKCSYQTNTSAAGIVPFGLQAAIPLRNFEFIQIWNLPRLFTWEGQTGLLPLGGKFLNAEGEDFMRRYCPKFGAKADPHYNVRGMAHEVREGRGPIFFDPSGMSDADKEIMRPKAGWMKLNDSKLLSLGIDFFNQKTEWIPQVIHSFGGLSVNEDCTTGVEGLFAAGRAVSIDPGVYLGGWSLCVCAVTGFRAGKAAGSYAAGKRSTAVSRKKTAEIIDSRLKWLGKDGIAPKDVIRALQNVISPSPVSILRTGKAMEDALERTREIRESLIPAMSASDAHQLCRCFEAEGIADLTEVTLLSSLARTESRAGQYREDYPDRDPGGPYWIHVTKEGSVFKTTRVRVPFEDYPYHPGKCYMDEFRFPRPQGAQQ